MIIRDERKRYIAGNRLPVPWLSQLGDTAKLASGDCGTACVAMLANWRGQLVSVDDVSKITKKIGFSALTFSDLILVALHFGLKLTHQRGLTFEDICAQIDKERPVIALINYQSLPAGGAFRVVSCAEFMLAYSTTAPGNTYALHALLLELE